MAFPKSSSQKKKYPINKTRTKIVAASLICAVMFVAIFFWPDIQTTTKPVSNTSVVASHDVQRFSCDAPKQSFCALQEKYVRMITQGYFSNVAESQQMIYIGCGGKNSITVECGSAPAGTAIGTYQVKIDGNTTYFSRNIYIAYFAKFEKVNGPFKFVESKMSGGGIVMDFTSEKTAASYMLAFRQFGTVWKLQSVAVN